jgi:hypothetical protein
VTDADGRSAPDPVDTVTTSASVRVVVELVRHGDGSVSGSVRASDGVVEPFSGWLELLAVLERAT